MPCKRCLEREIAFKEIRESLASDDYADSLGSRLGYRIFLLPLAIFFGIATLVLCLFPLFRPGIIHSPYSAFLPASVTFLLVYVIVNRLALTSSKYCECSKGHAEFATALMNTRLYGIAEAVPSGVELSATNTDVVEKDIGICQSCDRTISSLDKSHSCDCGLKYHLTCFYWIRQCKHGEYSIGYDNSVRIAESEVTCQICGECIADKFVTCEKCQTPHHPDCWEYNGGCSIFGCQSKSEGPSIRYAP